MGGDCGVGGGAELKGLTAGCSIGHKFGYVPHTDESTSSVNTEPYSRIPQKDK